MDRCPHSCLDLVLPDLSGRVQKKKQTQKLDHDGQAKQ